MWPHPPAAAASLTRAAAPATHAAPHTPTWAIIGIGLGVLLATITLALALVSNPPPPRHDSDDHPGSGPGGSGPRQPSPNDGNAPSGAPERWADFEQQFATYVSEQTASGALTCRSV
jgi:hypothetical protein